MYHHFSYTPTPACSTRANKRRAASAGAALVIRRLKQRRCQGGLQMPSIRAACCKLHQCIICCICVLHELLLSNLPSAPRRTTSVRSEYGAFVIEVGSRARSVIMGPHCHAICVSPRPRRRACACLATGSATQANSSQALMCSAALVVAGLSFTAASGGESERIARPSAASAILI